jgi:adenylate cyclase
MRIACSCQGREKTFERQADELIIGRPKGGVLPDLDLTPDVKVSGRHARLWLEQREYWIEDLGSTHGTSVNGEEIKGKGKRRLQAGDSVLIGETTLRVEFPAEPAGVDQPAESREHEAEPGPDMGETLDATQPAFAPAEAADAAGRRQALLYELPLQFASATRLEALFSLITERVLRALPGARRGAVLLGDELLLQASQPGDFRPSFSFARQALQQRQAFIWPPGEPSPAAGPAQGASQPPSMYGVASAMYVPLMWQGQALGVICVDNSEVGDAFKADDLRFLLAVAHHAAMAVANHQLRQELRENSRLLERLLTNFSPRIREKLLEEARHGRLRPGGKKSEVTILCSDIRGFTKISAGMDAQDVVEMLNQYFPPLVECIFKHDGAIDKFIGDAILAVFGSPEPVTQHQEKAVRAALAMQAATEKLNAGRAAQGLPACQMGIGIHCGEVIHGFIGTAERLEFTVIGDAVNRASRYCDGAGGGEILISPEMRARVWRAFSLEETRIATKHEGELPAYRVKQ